MDKVQVKVIKQMLDAKYYNMKGYVLYRGVPVTKLRKRHLVAILSEVMERRK